MLLQELLSPASKYEVARVWWMMHFRSLMESNGYVSVSDEEVERGLEIGLLYMEDRGSFLYPMPFLKEQYRAKGSTLVYVGTVVDNTNKTYRTFFHDWDKEEAVVCAKAFASQCGVSVLEFEYDVDLPHPRNVVAGYGKGYQIQLEARWV